jgi:hypothetical protein
LGLLVWVSRPAWERVLPASGWPPDILGGRT